MSKWHYQVMKHSDDRYAIHEYFEFGGGSSSWEKQPTRIDGESVEDIKKMLQMMLNDIDRHGVKAYGL